MSTIGRTQHEWSAVMVCQQLYVKHQAWDACEHFHHTPWLDEWHVGFVKSSKGWVLLRSSRDGIWHTKADRQDHVPGHSIVSADFPTVRYVTCHNPSQSWGCTAVVDVSIGFGKKEIAVRGRMGAGLNLSDEAKARRVNNSKTISRATVRLPVIRRQ